MGLFFRKEKKRHPPGELPQKIRAKLDRLAEKGNRLEEQGRHQEAVDVWQEALHLIPEPRQLYREAVWFLASVGDVCFRQGNYGQAHTCFEGARGNLSGVGGKYFEFLRTHVDLRADSQ